jgi:uncharacterized repeat protein (TIGR03803 family)
MEDAIMFKQATAFAVLIFSSTANHTALAAAHAPVSATLPGVASTQVELPLPFGNFGSAIAGPDGAYYASYEEGTTIDLVKITAQGAVTVLNTFSADGMQTYANSLRLDRDGALYSEAVSYNGSDVASVSFFRATADGTLTTLASINSTPDNSIFSSSDADFVQAADGAYYGVIDYGSQFSFYKLTAAGVLATVCSKSVNALNTFGPRLAAGMDGNIYGIWVDTGTAFRLTPACDYSEIYTQGSKLTSLFIGHNGNLYVTDIGTPAPGSIAAASEQIIMLTTSGAPTVLHTFVPETYRHYVKGSWQCLRGGCWWTPPYWQESLISLNANGDEPDFLTEGSDGYLYGVNRTGGLHGNGTLFRLSSDGSTFSTLSSVVTLFGIPAISAQGNTGFLVESSADSSKLLLNVDLNSPLATSISFSKPAVRLGQSSVLSWSSADAQSCQLMGDIPGLQTGSVATTGSTTVRIYTTGLRSPASYSAGIECTAADGSISNAAATVTIK